MAASDTGPINLNLATVEERAYPDYVFSVDGVTTFRFTDPTVLDWQVVERLTTLEVLAEHCMTDADRKGFYGSPLPAYKLDILWEDVQRHFELGEFAKKRRR